MPRRELFLLLIILVCFLLASTGVCAQTAVLEDHKFEVGGQFTLLTTSIVNNDLSTPCLTISCSPSGTFVLSRSRKTQPGFGGRIGYNLNSNVALEAELNVFPGADSFSQPEAFNDGSFLEGLFGVKAGKRFEKVGIFGKARPGFLYASKGDLEPKPDVGCITIFPPPVGCFQTTSTTSFALDVGGVLEVYPTERTVIRFDFGNTVIRFSERNVSAAFNGLTNPILGVLRIPAETTHNFQGSVGVGFRF
jgi:Outer membrane protein beta-barrel domain